MSLNKTLAEWLVKNRNIVGGVCSYCEHSWARISDKGCPAGISTHAIEKKIVKYDAQGFVVSCEKFRGAA